MTNPYKKALERLGVIESFYEKNPMASEDIDAVHEAYGMFFMENYDVIKNALRRETGWLHIGDAKNIERLGATYIFAQKMYHEEPSSWHYSFFRPEDYEEWGGLSGYERAMGSCRDWFFMEVQEPNGDEKCE